MHVTESELAALHQAAIAVITDWAPFADKDKSKFLKYKWHAPAHLHEKTKYTGAQVYTGDEKTEGATMCSNSLGPL